MADRNPLRSSDAQAGCLPHHALRRRAAVLALCLLVWCDAAQAFAVRHSIKHVYQKQVDALEMEWRDAMLHGDVAVLDHLLSDDYIGITANGTVQTKEETLERTKSRSIDIKRLDLSEIKAAIHGDTAVVTSKAELEVVSGGGDVSGTFRYTRVYLRKAGAWKIVNFEATRITPRPEKHQQPVPANP